MEFVDGQTLREIVKTTGPMTQQKVIEVMADVCAALDFSHRHQIIHRDVKPANIMINRAGAVKVMDFGIARALGEGQNVTQTAAVIGTAQYLSPEQARGEAVDARSDVYAAGCVLYELLTGEPPFTGDTPVAVAYQHVREDPKSPVGGQPEHPSRARRGRSSRRCPRTRSTATSRPPRCASDLVRVRSGQTPMAPIVMSEDERTAMLAPGPATGPTRRINGGRHNGVPASYDYDDERPERSTGRTVGIVVAVLAALALVAFVAYQIFGPPPPPSQVAVPNVVDLEAQQARNQILGLGLRLGEEQLVESTVERKGTVIGVSPGVGVLVDERSSVVLQIGNGPATAAVPALTGRTPEEAQTLLTQRGLTLGEQTTRETADADQIGKIIESTPRAGEDAPGGSAVAVVVGIEQTTVAVPDVSSQTAQQAQQALEALGFVVTTSEVDGGGDQGSVLGTNPAAGTQAQKGSQVTLQISRGNRIEVPNVEGLSRDDAVDRLREAGFRRIQQRDQDVNDPNQDDRVLDQSIAPGSSAQEDDEITITYGNFDNGGFFGN